MSDYYATAQTNYFKVSNLEGLKNAISNFDIILLSNAATLDNPDSDFALISDNDGGWSTLIHTAENDEVIDFNFHEHVMTFVNDNVIVVAVESGAENGRQPIGLATAFIKNNDVIKEVNISTNDIYDLAAKEFNVDRHSITTI